MASTPETSAAVSAVERLCADVRELIEVLPSVPSAKLIATVESLGRLVDAARVHVAAPLASYPGESERLGYSSPVAAVATIARVSERAARERLAIASGVSLDRSITGAPLPPPYPALAAALDSGAVGVDAALLVCRELEAARTRVDAPVLADAEAIMVNLASGLDAMGEHSVAPVSVTYLATEIHQIGATIDPDGAMPREQRAARRRMFRVGQPDQDGLCAASGRLLPEVASLFNSLVEASRRSPRFVEAEVAELEASDFAGSDTRTPDQRRHDVLAELLVAASSAKGAPTLDGQPVSVIVTVAGEDLDREDGLDGDPVGILAGSPVPISRASVERFIDASGYRRVTLGRNGKVTAISSVQRCFTPAQRAAIGARDGYRCSTPGCTSPHYALQVHHVTPWRHGGTTTTGNGILLCYWHHKRVDDGPWQYRMIDGVPEVRGPGLPEWTRVSLPLRRSAQGRAA